ncbi:hypothetical protein [Pedobacter cryoconitis]|uniref:hypothetical protein n=1 Tax=Pedobacter cryoconitis TaxID=188932 RepID=UPI00161DC48D|nr:hypothetical protein [Pedobacter cryoconitis]MBB5646188.1 hypothetical protein [Pedobacter cryoconitis]
MAKNKKHRLIFELSKSERELRLKSALNEVIQLTVDMQKPFVYRNNLCIQPNFFIHQYPNGKKYLISQDQENSKENILRELA